MLRMGDNQQGGRMAHVIRKRGDSSEFSEAKIFESCYAACLRSGIPLGEAERVSSRVASNVGRWAGGRTGSIQSSEVLSRVVEELKGLDCPLAADTYRLIVDAF